MQDIEFAVGLVIIYIGVRFGPAFATAAVDYIQARAALLKAKAKQLPGQNSEEQK